MKPICQIILCFLVLLSGCALQRDVVILEDRLIDLENQNQALQRQSSKLQQQLQQDLKTLNSESQSSETNLRTQYATMNVSLESVQQEIRAVSGRIDEMDHAVNHKMGDFEKIGGRIDELKISVAKLEKRLDAIELYLNFDEKGTPPNGGPPTPQGQKNVTADSAQQLYDNAKQAYDNGQLDKARQGFTQLIQSYPKSENADNAQFWIGESYYREKWYEKAILEYQTVIEKYPKGNKVPAAMLKQGMAFIQLGDKSNARLILKELEKKFPQTNEAKIATTKLKEL
jgi:tol-pal system protein YbgF